MADKKRTFAASAKNSKIKRLSADVSTRNVQSASAVKEKTVSRQKVNKNTTLNGDNEVSKCKDAALPDFDVEHRKSAYGKYLRGMLKDCLVDEKIKREETEIDIQMAQLADRFKNTIDQLDRTNRRVKDISFMVEQKRLLDLKSQDCSKFYDMTENASIKYQDNLEIKNVDFGHSKDTGHKQLLDAVNEAIDGLDRIKKHSNLDLQKFKEFSQAETHLTQLEKDRFDLESLKTEFDDKFPNFSERLLKEASEKIALMMRSDDEGCDTGDDDDDD